MKNTKKSLIIEIISLIVIVAVIGAVIGMVSSMMKDANTMLNDAYGNLIGEDISLGEDTSSGESGEDGTDTGTESDTTLSDDSKITLAEGEILYAVRPNKSLNKNLLVVFTYELKPNTDYKVSWKFENYIDSNGFNFPYYDSDGNGLMKPYINITLSSDISKGYTRGTLDTVEELKFLENSYNFTTNDEGYLEIGFFEAEYSESAEVQQAQMEAFINLINYVEIVEV